MRKADGQGLDISIVVYHPDARILAQTLESLAAAVAALRAEDGGARVWIIDNAEKPETEELRRLIADTGIESAAPVTLMSGHGNPGYGGGHNLAIRQGTGAFHLVLNPDVRLDEGTLVEGLHFMKSHPEVVLASPLVVNDAGKREFICKHRPNLFDLVLRGFMPVIGRAWFPRRLARYEMSEVTLDEPVFGIECAGGAFMLFRRGALEELGGFDEDFFLYFEDFDLSKRAGALGTVAYAPSMRIVHHGGNAARKGARHILMFIVSAARYFAKHGWALR